MLARSTITNDFASLVDQQEYSDIVFLLDSSDIIQNSFVSVYANRSLVLHRIYEKESREIAFANNISSLRMEEALDTSINGDSKSRCIV